MRNGEVDQANAKIDAAIAKVPTSLELAFGTEVTVANVKSAIEAIEGIDLTGLTVTVTDATEGNYTVEIQDTQGKGTKDAVTVAVTVAAE